MGWGGTRVFSVPFSVLRGIAERRFLSAERQVYGTSPIVADSSSAGRSGVTFVPAREAAQVAVDLEIAAGLRAVVVVLAAVQLLIEPDTWQHIELLIGGNSLLDGDHPFRRHVPDFFFARLKRRDWCLPTTGRTIVARFNHGQRVRHCVDSIGPCTVLDFDAIVISSTSCSGSAVPYPLTPSRTMLPKSSGQSVASEESTATVRAAV